MKTRRLGVLVLQRRSRVRAITHRHSPQPHLKWLCLTTFNSNFNFYTILIPSRFLPTRRAQAVKWNRLLESYPAKAMLNRNHPPPDHRSHHGPHNLRRRAQLAASNRGYSPVPRPRARRHQDPPPERCDSARPAVASGEAFHPEAVSEE